MNVSDDLLDLIRREAENAVQKWAPGHRFGIVSQYNPATQQVRVTFPDDIDAGGNPTLSPWMPIISPNGSPFTGTLAPPLMGSQAMVVHFGFGADRFTFMLGVVRPASDPPPDGGPKEGEWWTVTPGGASIKLTSDGHVSISDNSGSYINLTNNNNIASGSPSGDDDSGGYNLWTHEGDMSVDGNLSAFGDITAGQTITGNSLVAQSAASGSFTTSTGNTVTVVSGIVTHIG